jgi:hypothetical protein
MANTASTKRVREVRDITGDESVVQVEPPAKKAKVDQSCLCYIGNISLMAQLSEISALLSVVGSLVKLRIFVMGLPEGDISYALCEYTTAESARSAIRNLHGRVFFGRRLYVAAPDQILATPASQPTVILPGPAAIPNPTHKTIDLLY